MKSHLERQAKELNSEIESLLKTEEWMKKREEKLERLELMINGYDSDDSSISTDSKLTTLQEITSDLDNDINQQSTFRSLFNQYNYPQQYQYPQIPIQQYPLIQYPFPFQQSMFPSQYYSLNQNPLKRPTKSKSLKRSSINKYKKYIY